MKSLLTYLQGKDWAKMRAWVVDNMDSDPNAIIRKIYDSYLDEFKNISTIILLLADYQYKSAFSVDQEINLVACLTEIMATAVWK